MDPLLGLGLFRFEVVRRELAASSAGDPRLQSSTSVSTRNTCPSNSASWVLTHGGVSNRSVQVAVLGLQDILDARVPHLVTHTQAVEVLGVCVVLDVDHDDLLHAGLAL